MVYIILRHKHTPLLDVRLVRFFADRDAKESQTVLRYDGVVLCLHVNHHHRPRRSDAHQPLQISDGKHRLAPPPATPHHEERRHTPRQRRKCPPLRLFTHVASLYALCKGKRRGWPPPPFRTQSSLYSVRSCIPSMRSCPCSLGTNTADSRMGKSRLRLWNA